MPQSFDSSPLPTPPDASGLRRLSARAAVPPPRPKINTEGLDGMGIMLWSIYMVFMVLTMDIYG